MRKSDLRRVDWAYLDSLKLAVQSVWQVTARGTDGLAALLPCNMHQFPWTRITALNQELKINLNTNAIQAHNPSRNDYT
eukprot:5205358-Amphidinium_carterae.1